ncbi:phosphoribosylformylglycinamidine cyclo-ligase [candidate division WOR-3 bacterium]|nr:phosphoribosylformylglycinamidine cyclo-ligase [candidate division WOR-3 bacterium]
MLYRDAGVDIERMNAVKKEIGRIVRKTYLPEVISEVGLFGSLFKIPRKQKPVLVASCDSVGTKVLIAREMGIFNTVGIDIVNHCVNDILTLGAKPLFFLDYIAHSDLSSNQLLDLIKGLANACRQNGCALVGGETAMMPDIYRNGDFDLVGFIVGIVEQDQIVDAQKLKPGDVAIGIPSNGLHTNGYSLARKVLFKLNRLTVHSKVQGLKYTLGKELLRPHRSYFKLVYPLLNQVKAVAHITGGGFYDNISRLLPPETSCIIKKSTWRPPPIFQLIQKLGAVPDEEMYRTFNMGIGMVLFVAPDKAATMRRRIPGARVIGKIVRGTFAVAVI